MTEIHVTDWPVEIPRASDGESWEFAPETWAPDFAGLIYWQQVNAHNNEPGSAPVPMTYRWERRPI